MREIKFRAWNVKSQVMVDDFVISPTGKKLTHSGNLLYEGVYETKLELMQFTGLKDKKGTEIYEGDIVRQRENAWGYREHLMVIEWNEEYLCLQGKVIAKVGDDKNGVSVGSGGWSFSVWKRTPGMFEVIGNIYENKELLEQK